MEQKKALHQFALASFLLGDDGRHRFTFSYGRGQNALTPQPLNETRLGQPLGRYANIDGAYQRSFTKGRVLVNPTDATVTVALGGTYTTPAGVRVSSVTLAPHTGSILTNG